MKKLLLLCILTILFTGCGKKEIETTIEIEENLSIKTTFKEECSHDMDIYYQINDQKIFISCIENIFLIEDETSIILRDYLEKTSIDEILEKITSKMKKDKNLKDDKGSTYKSGNLRIVTCNTGTKDIYFGNDKIIKNEELCAQSLEKQTIQAEIKEIHDDGSILIEDDESAKRFIIINASIFEDPNEKYQIGTKIRVTYDGSADYSDPLQISAYEIIIIN